MGIQATHRRITPEEQEEFEEILGMTLCIGHEDLMLLRPRRAPGHHLFAYESGEDEDEDWEAEW